MWEGEQWELFGKGIALLIPILLVGAAIVGGFAANTYNQGAEYGVTACMSWVMYMDWTMYPIALVLDIFDCNSTSCLQLLPRKPFTRSSCTDYQGSGLWYIVQPMHTWIL